MTARSTAPNGVPCWADLWTSDVAGSRAFYRRVLGWESEDPNPEFGGYFMFTRQGVPVAGAMGDMGDMKANDTWKIYLASDDISKSVEAAEGAGAQVVVPPMEVGDAGHQAVIVDPGGAELGIWQAKEFPGFTVLNEPASPDWFELLTRDYRGALDFYRSAFGWDLQVVGDTDDFRYSVLRDPAGQGELAGIMDAGGFLAAGEPVRWAVYWAVDDVDAVVETATANGGAVVAEPVDTPYGRLAGITDPSGAQFKLRKGPA
jgi:predicted enzyme related to lactoylglutathione lyase